MKHHIRPLLNMLIPWYTISWLLSGCFGPVNKDSEVQITIQDSTGKPIPGFSLTLIGIKSSFTGAKQVEEYYPTADQAGIITQKLSWHDGISYYVIFVGSSYEIDDWYGRAESDSILA